MKKIVVGFMDYFYPMDEFFIDILSREYQVERDDKNPEYMFFCDNNFGKAKYSFEGNAKKIFFTGENVRPMDCHFAISFDHCTDDRHYRLPLYVMDNWVNRQLGLPCYTDRGAISKRTLIPYDARYSISFLVKNHNCVQRNQIFDLISKNHAYINSGGPWKNTIGYEVGSDKDPNVPNFPKWNGKLKEELYKFQMSKYWFLRNSKVNLCYENSSYPGYVTEKLYHAIVYDTVPAYWGSPTVDMDFNPGRFICRHDYRNDNDFIEGILFFLGDEPSWTMKVNEEPFIQTMFWKGPMNIDNLLNFFRKVVIT